jgi:hypothetical protein
VPVADPPHAGKAVAESQHRLCYIPPQTAPGLGPPRPWNGAWVQLLHSNAEWNIE